MGAGRKAGIIGVAGIVILLICAVISAAMYENGAFTPENRFITELGYYVRGYFAASPALIFNAGMIVSGLLLCIFAVMYGIRKNTPLDTAASFFCIVTGILLAAQGLVTLNYAKYHLFIEGAFFAAVFLMCLFTVISQVRSANSSIAALIFAFLAGAASALSSIYIFIGGLNKTFITGASYADRAAVMPCAIVQWGVYVMFLLLLLVQSSSMLADAGEPEDEFESDDEYEPEDGFKPTDEPAGRKRWHNDRDIDL